MYRVMLHIGRRGKSLTPNDRYTIVPGPITTHFSPSDSRSRS